MGDAKRMKFEEVMETEAPTSVSFVIDWTIPNFSFYKKHTSPMKTKQRTVGSYTWHLELCPLVTTEQKGVPKESVGLHIFGTPLQKGNSNNTTINRLVAKFGFVGTVNTRKQLLQGKTGAIDVILTNHPENFGTLISHKEIFDSRDGSGILAGDKLTVLADVELRSLNPVPSAGIQLPSNADALLESFKDLYEGKASHDFILVSSDGKEIPVHRTVLIARSPVFAAMFESNLTETRTGRCAVSDVDAAVLTVLVKYMYCGCAEADIKKNAKKILVAADKYQLTALVNQCEQYSMGVLSPKNAIEMLLLTDTVVSATALKNASCRYIRSNLPQFKGSGALKRLFEHASPGLVDEFVGLLPAVW